MTDAPVLYVDLDDTLVRTDTFYECLLAAARHRPWQLLMLFIWIRRGKAYVKHHLARAARPFLTTFPYCPLVLDYIEKHRRQGGEVVLATAANQQIANAVADDLGCFTAVLASDERTNLSGKNKLAAIAAHAAGRPFEYIGDHANDLPIWKAAERAIAVRCSPRVWQSVHACPNAICLEERRPRSIGTWLRLLHLPHLAANLLVLVPVLFAHPWTSPAKLTAALISLVCFCLSTSAVDLADALFDLEVHRADSAKRKQPIAAGEVSIRTALVVATALTAAALLISAAMLTLTFTAVLLGFLVLSMLHSLYMKRVPLIATFMLISLYAYRVFAGAVATGVL
ncbi:MAG: haloacid dehalogenase-like hydrolase [Pirellulales bacterium]